MRIPLCTSKKREESIGINIITLSTLFKLWLKRYKGSIFFENNRVDPDENFIFQNFLFIALL